MSDQYKMPQWWRALVEFEHVRDNPLLYACASAGLTERQALYHLSESHAEVMKRCAKLAEFQPPPPIMLQVTEEERDNIVSNIRKAKT